MKMSVIKEAKMMRGQGRELYRQSPRAEVWSLSLKDGQQTYLRPIAALPAYLPLTVQSPHTYNLQLMNLHTHMQRRCRLHHNSDIPFFADDEDPPDTTNQLFQFPTWNDTTCIRTAHAPSRTHTLPQTHKCRVTYPCANVHLSP